MKKTDKKIRKFAGKTFSKKSQTVMIDLFIAFFIFMFMTGAMGVVWNLYTIRLMQHISVQDRWIKAFQITDIMVRTPGIPSNWEKYYDPIDEYGIDPNNISIIGLAGDDRVLTRKKLNAFYNLTPGNVSELFNIEMYAYNMTIKRQDDNSILPGNHSGVPIGGNLSVTIRRFIKMEGVPDRLILEFSLFEKR